jgi:hypothetical protein
VEPTETCASSPRSDLRAPPDRRVLEPVVGHLVEPQQHRRPTAPPFGRRLLGRRRGGRAAGRSLESDRWKSQREDRAALGKRPAGRSLGRGRRWWLPWRRHPPRLRWRAAACRSPPVTPGCRSLPAGRVERRGWRAEGMASRVLE